MARITRERPSMSYQALALMTRLFYERLGEDTIPIIREVWYEMGLAAGEKLKEKLPNHDFKSAASAFKEQSERVGTMGTCEVSNKLYHVISKPGCGCGVGLENAGRSICEAVMSVRQGQFKAICGYDVKMNIIRSYAVGDNCCEITYCPVDIPDKQEHSGD